MPAGLLPGGVLQLESSECRWLRAGTIPAVLAAVNPWRTCVAEHTGYTEHSLSFLCTLAMR